MAKNVKSHVFWDFEKKRKNVEVITYRSIGLKTTVTTLNQFCYPSRNYQGHMWGLF